MPLTRGRPPGPVSPSLQRAVESLTPTSAAELAHAARQRTEQDALKTLALFLDEPATAESVVMVRPICGCVFPSAIQPADSRVLPTSDTTPQLVINRAEVEGRCDPRSPVVATAAALLVRLLSSLQPHPGQTALDAVLRCCDTILGCRLTATSSQGGPAAGVQATVRTVQHLRRVAATLHASTSPTPTRGTAASPADVPPPPEASPARRSRRSLSLGSAAAAAAAARAAWLQEAPALDVPSDVFAWRWGGDARLAQMLAPPARSLRCAPGCSLSLSAWLLGSDLGGDGGGTRGGGGGHAGVADAATAARHVAQIEADRAARRATFSRAQQQQQQQQQYDTYGNVSVSSGGDGTEAMYGAGTSTRGGSEAAHSGATTEAMWQPVGNTQPRGQGGLRAGWASPPMGGQYGRPRGLSRGFLGAYNASRRPPVKLAPGDVSAVVQVVSAGQAPHVAAGLSGGGGQGSLRRSASGSFLSLLTGAVQAPPHSGASIRKFSGGSGGPGIHMACADVAGGVLVRLVWDQFTQSGPEGATTAVAPLLRNMLASPRPRGRCAAFDLLLTCAVHVPWSGALDVGPEEGGDDTSQRVRHASAHVAACHAWLRTLCADCMLALAASGEGHALVWHSATSVLFTLSARNGRLVLPYISAACPLPAMRALVDASLAHGWNRELVGALLRALAAMLYDPDPTWHGDSAAAGSPGGGGDKALRRASSDGAGFGASGGPKHMFVRDRVTLVGGTPWLVRMLAAAPPCRLTRGALMAPLLDVAMAAAEAMGGGRDGDNTSFHALLAAALHLSRGADAVTVAALGGHSGVAAALADGLCACWPVETSLGGRLEATGAHNAVPPVLIALEALCTSACALPPQLGPWVPGACASAVRGDDMEGTGMAGPLWAPFVDLLKSPHAGERRDGAAWLVLALRDAALVATASPRVSAGGGSGKSAADGGADGARIARGGGQTGNTVAGVGASEPFDESGGDLGDGLGPSGSPRVELDAPSVLPDPDTPLGMLLGDCVTPEPPPCGPPWVRSLVEKALLQALLSCQPFSAPSGAGGAAIGAWALATLEDAALRLATHGGQGAAVEATEMVVGALAVYPDDTGDDLWAASSTSGRRRQAPRRGDGAAPGQRAASTWHSHCACFLSGGCTMPMALLRRMRLDTLLALFTALAPLPVTAEEQGGGATAAQQAWLSRDPSRMGLTSRPRCSPASDARAAVALLLLARCAGCEPELEELGGEATVRVLTDDADARVAYAAACFLLARLARAAPGAYRAGLRRLVLHAQGADDERFLDNPHFRFMALAMY